MHPTFTLRDVHHLVLRASDYRQQRRFVKRFEPCVKNQLISSHRFAGRFKQCCTQNSERLLQTPVNEKDGSARKIASSREGAVSVDRCAEDGLVPLSCRNQTWQSLKEEAGQRGFRAHKTVCPNQTWQSLKEEAGQRGFRAHKTVCPQLSRGVGLLELFSTTVSSDAVFVTLFPTTVETSKDTSVLAILTFDRFCGHVSLCDW